jgi:hypothetical protein
LKRPKFEIYTRVQTLISKDKVGAGINLTTCYVEYNKTFAEFNYLCVGHNKILWYLESELTKVPNQDIIPEARKDET